MTETQSSQQDVVDVLTADHHAMLDLLRQIQGNPDPQERRDTADTVIAEVMRHSVAEEMIVYPAVQKHVPGGDEEVEHDKQEHDELVDVMKQLEDVDASGAEFLDLIKTFEDKLDHHVHDEEDEQFPKLRENIPQGELVEMAEKVEKAKQAAPTRPHPNAPHSELFHKSVGPGVGMVDRLRDKLTGRNTD
ncbi:hemerythrin domain-containing protein [Brachybacterium sp. GCM10030267]|uniref:hemerythrin domain-containing protein n=1 Tax=unclassified Brachybacterium TaxID=2623841 RepID=UPI0036161875